MEARRHQALTLPIAISVLAAVIVQTSPASAACADTEVRAQGEPSKYEWLAKTKARANWRRKVRSTPGLGNAYGNWANAVDTEERCLSGGAGTVCIFTGRPCTP